MRPTLMAAVVLAGLAAPAAAQDVEVFYTGSQLLAFCESRVERDIGACLGIIAGTSDMLSGISARGGNYAGSRVCKPKSVTIGQVQDVVVQHLLAHPEDRHLTAVSLVAEALAKAWPCR